MVKEILWSVGFQDQEWFNMILRFTGGDFTDLLNEQDKFILLVYYDGQQITHDSSHMLSIVPTEHSKFERSDNKVMMDTFSGATFIETYHSESYDLVNHFGFSYDELWDEENKIHRPLIVSVNKGWIVKSSLGECYCSETYVDLIHSIYPELFIPTSISES